MELADEGQQAQENPLKKIKRRGVGLALRGFAMGIADVIPGVSGATIALITGIYDELLATIAGVNTNVARSFLGGRFLEGLQRVNAGFLVPLLFGVGLAFISFAKLITYLLKTHPAPVWGFFTGLIIASALFVAKQAEVRNPRVLIALIAGLATGYGVAVLVPMQTGSEIHKFFLTGAVAIIAFILPGLSGSFILVLLGKYQQVFEAIHQRDLAIIAVFGAGCAVGLLLFSRLLKWLLARFYSATLIFLVGLMLGSLRKVWPFQRVLETETVGSKEVVTRYECILPETFDGEVLLVFALMAAAGVLVLGLERLGRQKEE